MNRQEKEYWDKLLSLMGIHPIQPPKIYPIVPNEEFVPTRFKFTGDTTNDIIDELIEDSRYRNYKIRRIQ